MSREKKRRGSKDKSAAAEHKALEELKEENAKIKEKLSEVLSGTFGESGLLKSLEEAEKKNAQLHTDKIVLEEQLGQYKTFMTKEIAKYKAQIQKLKRAK